MYENIFCHVCGQLVCQSCGCCCNPNCEHASCPDISNNTLTIKIRNKEFILTDKDEIMFNGACYILATQKVFSGYYEVNPTVSKTLCTKLIKEGRLVRSRIVQRSGYVLTYYKIKRGEDNVKC